MLSSAFFLARLDVRYLLRSRSTLLWTFVMPIVFFYFIGTITGGMSGSRETKDVIAVRLPADAGYLAEQLIRRLEERSYKVVRVTDEQQMVRYPRQLVIPAHFTESVLGGVQAKVAFTRNGDQGLGGDYDEIRVSRAVYSILADLIAVSKNDAPPTREALEELARRPRNLTLQVTSAGHRMYAPRGFDQAVPGTMVMFTLLVQFTAGAITLTIERNQGILRRLASAPMSRTAVLLGKMGARMVLGIIQVSFAMATGSLLFGVHWGPNLPMIAVVLLCYTGLTTMLGMLLGNFARTEGQASGIGVLASNVMAALGGCWWPIEVTPDWAQSFASFLPTGWAMSALHKLVNFGEPPATVIPQLVAMIVATVVAGYIVRRSFRFQ